MFSGFLLNCSVKKALKSYKIVTFQSNMCLKSRKSICYVKPIQSSGSRPGPGN